jgi:fructuronate reductase
MSYLSNSTVTGLTARGIRTPQYDRGRVELGIVHFGPGAFHRAHQAYYVDEALHSDPRWGICEVALQSMGVRDALAPQDGLYTIAILDKEPGYRVIGSIYELLVARESPQAVIARLVDPAVKLVTATITEKGYCLRPDGGLDLAHPDIQHDLAHPDAPRTLIGYLAYALGQRRARGIAPPNVVSCDNLADNGERLCRAVVELAAHTDAALAKWIEANVPFPCTMVDSITPATDDALRTRVAEALGVEDRWPVQREAFCQWVIEDALVGPQPNWSALGVTVTSDVAAFERAKLRILNGAHSTLAYVGSLAGLATVYEAVSQPALNAFIERLMREDFRASLEEAPGLDLDRYIEQVLARFRNPAIRHLLAQIAWDGSQKLPFRILNTMGETRAAGRSIERLCVPVAAWLHFVRRKASAGEAITDPMAERLNELGRACSGEAAHDVALLLSLERFWPETLVGDAVVRSALVRAYERLRALETPQDLATVFDGTL